MKFLYTLVNKINLNVDSDYKNKKDFLIYITSLTTLLTCSIQSFAKVDGPTIRYLQVEKDVQSLLSSASGGGEQIKVKISRSIETWRAYDPKLDPESPLFDKKLYEENKDVIPKINQNFLIVGFQSSKKDRSIVDRIPSINNVRLSCELYDKNPTDNNDKASENDVGVSSISADDQAIKAESTTLKLDEIQYNVFSEKEIYDNYKGYKSSIVLKFMSDKDLYKSKDEKEAMEQSLLYWDTHQNIPTYRYVVTPVDNPENKEFIGESQEQSLEKCKTYLETFLFDMHSYTNYNDYKDPISIYITPRKLKNNRDLDLKMQDEAYDYLSINNKEITSVTKLSLDNKIKYYTLESTGVDNKRHQNVHVSCDVEKRSSTKNVLSPEIDDLGRVNFEFTDNTILNGVPKKLGKLRQVYTTKDGEDSSRILNYLDYESVNGSSKSADSFETKVFQVYNTTDDDKVEALGSGSVANPVSFPNYIIVLKFNRVNREFKVSVMNFSKNYLWFKTLNIKKDYPSLQNLLQSFEGQALISHLKQIIQNQFMSDETIYFSKCEANKKIEKSLFEEWLGL